MLKVVSRTSLGFCPFCGGSVIVTTDAKADIPMQSCDGCRMVFTVMVEKVDYRKEVAATHE